MIGFAAEYNPMHSGHLFHVCQIKKQFPKEPIVCVMSGSFTQRGEPAIMDKWARALSAVKNGVDLVVELPLVWATGSSDIFAKGSIYLLNQLGVNRIAFGSESADLHALEKTADFLEQNRHNLGKHVKKGLKSGKTYAASIADFVNSNSQIPGILKKSNDLLGVSYIRALKNINPALKVTLIKRKGADYSDTLMDIRPNETFLSATAIRELITNIFKNTKIEDIIKNSASGTVIKETEKAFEDLKNYLPPNTFKIFINQAASKRAPVLKGDIEDFAILRSRALAVCDLIKFAGMKNGFENRFLKVIKECTDFDSLLEALKNKNITMARIKRILCWLLLNITEADIAGAGEYPPYIRPLAYNLKGRSVLKKIRKNTVLPVISKIKGREKRIEKFNRAAAKTGSPLADVKKIAHNLEMEFRATDIWAALLRFKGSRAGGLDFTVSPVQAEKEEENF
jgi:predicted nucleotidyltransferase